MAQLHSLTINEPTKSEQITLEEQAKLQEEAKSEIQKQQALELDSQEETAEDTDQPEVERPEWLPEKFTDAEELAKAYANLEKDYHTKQREDDKEQVTAEQQAIQDSVNSAVTLATEEFTEKGELSETSFSNLESAGIGRDLVEMYVKGVQSVQQEETNQVMSEVGGKENYDAMSTWAATALTDDDLNAYNAAVDSGDLNTAKMAIKGMYARFLRDGGEPVTIEKGQVAGANIAPFNSTAQVTEAMRDPRYDKDPAYRAHVEKRLSVSTNV